MPVARLAFDEYRAGGDVESGKQGVAVANMIMSDALDLA